MNSEFVIVYSTLYILIIFYIFILIDWSLKIRTIIIFRKNLRKENAWRIREIEKKRKFLIYIYKNIDYFLYLYS